MLNTYEILERAFLHFWPPQNRPQKWALSRTKTSHFTPFFGWFPGIWNVPNLSKFVQICPNLSKFVQICPNFVKFCPILANFVKFCPNLDKFGHFREISEKTPQNQLFTPIFLRKLGKNWPFLDPRGSQNLPKSAKNFPEIRNLCTPQKTPKLVRFEQNSHFSKISFPLCTPQGSKKWHGIQGKISHPDQKILVEKPRFWPLNLRVQCGKSQIWGGWRGRNLGIS